MPRTVTLVFVGPSGEPIGALAPFEVATPWWPDAAPVVAGARDLHKVEVTYGRLSRLRSGNVCAAAELASMVRTHH